MEPFVFIIVCILLIMALEELGIIIVVVMILYNCTGENPNVRPGATKPQVVEEVKSPPKAPHYEYVEQPLEGDPICEDGYNLMVDTHTGNKACILGANYY